MGDDSGITRREFFVAAGSASLLGCSEKQARRILPYVIPPDDLVPGVARRYRTVCRECPAGCGLEVRTREGRAVKLEGNPDHPLNRGALCLRGQAAIEGLYHPERLGEPLGPSGSPISWDEAEAALARAVEQALASGKRIFILSRPERGSLGELFRSWLAALGEDPRQVVTFQPMFPSWLRTAMEETFGIAELPVFDLSRARMLLSIGDDFLENEVSPVEHARGLAELRARGGRFVYVGPRLSLTAAAADEWLAPRPGTELALVQGLLRMALELRGETVPGLRTALAPYGVEEVARTTELPAQVIRRLGREFLGAIPSLCLGPGHAADGDPVTLGIAVNFLNVLSGNVGETVRFLDSEARAEATLTELTEAARAGGIGLLVVHHVDPLAYGQASRRLRETWPRIPFVAVFGHSLDESARSAHLVLADHHFLESWGDDTSRPHVTAIQQPVMTPVRATRPAADVLLGVARRLGKTTGLPDGDFGAAIRAKYPPSDIERGGSFGEPRWRAVAPRADALARRATSDAGADALVLVTFPSLRHPGGRPPAGALLQEIPDPVTTISWSGWVELHPDTARHAGVSTGDLVRLETDEGGVELPAYLYAGVRPDVVAVPAAYAWDVVGGRRVHLVKTGRRVVLPRAEGSHSQEGRELAREVSSSFPRLGGRARLPTMVPAHAHPEHRWGMAVDLDRCLGCGACVAACHVENNIPLVGATEVARGREMSWIRIDRFLEPARMRFLPVFCQHCDHAPCETVCPTYATYHTAEGLNAQIYNRCVGTRYCANNCPYNARRFNWRDAPHPPPTELGLNPDVTVRERGVMEKCTFCVQRIREAAENAKLDGRRLEDGEIVPACAQTCPAQALVFGDLLDPESSVSRLARDGRAYRLLEHLNTEPAVAYLARVRKVPAP